MIRAEYAHKAVGWQCALHIFESEERDELRAIVQVQAYIFTLRFEIDNIRHLDK